MTDIESQGDETDYGNKQYVSMVQTINSQSMSRSYKRVRNTVATLQLPG